ncbi:MAG: SMC-Scp complex subunit ScpB [Planctomycetota bacterium]
MEISLRIAPPAPPAPHATNAPRAAAPATPAARPTSHAPAATPAPATPPARPGSPAQSHGADFPTERPQTQDFPRSLAAAVGRLRLRLTVAPEPYVHPQTARFAPPPRPAIPPQPAAAVAAVPPRLFLGPIPLAKHKPKRKSETDEQVIPLVLPDFIDPQEVRGRVPRQAEEIDFDGLDASRLAAAADAAGALPAAAPVPTQRTPPNRPNRPNQPIQPDPSDPDDATPSGGANAAATAAADAAPQTPAADDAQVAADTPAPDASASAPAAAEATPPATMLVRPGPDPVPAQATAMAAPEETVEQRIARIKTEDEELRSDERRVLKIANDVGKLSSMVEVILFQNAKPLTINQIARALPGKVVPKLLRQALQLVADRFDRGAHPIELVEIAGGWQLVVRSGFQELIEALAGGSRKRVLTGSIMETLAIIAYRQGTTKIEIETLRGINDCGPHLRQLIEMGLAASGRRSDLPGAPMGYWTTALFMRAVGIRSLEELGKMGEFAPTEVAGLVEVEVPDPAAAAPTSPSAESTGASDDADRARETVDADSIDAAMRATDPADPADRPKRPKRADRTDASAATPEAASDDPDAAEADSALGAPSGELFGDAVVIPVDPADRAAASAPSPSAGSTESADRPTPPPGKAKRTRHRRGAGPA